MRFKTFNRPVADFALFGITGDSMIVPVESLVSSKFQIPDNEDYFNLGIWNLKFGITEEPEFTRKLRVSTE